SQTQRTDNIRGHRQLLSWMRLTTPRSSRQAISPATHDLSSGDNAQDEPQSAGIAKRFSALAHSVESLQCSNSTAIGGTADMPRIRRKYQFDVNDPKRS